MKIKISVLGHEIEVSSTLLNSGVPFPNHDEKTAGMHNEFRVVVKTGIAKTEFKYYGSQHDFESGKTELDETDLKFAFRSFIEDAIAGMQDFHEFCSEFGYDEDSRKAEKIWKLCQKSADKTKKLGLDDSELYDIVNNLSEQGIE